MPILGFFALLAALSFFAFALISGGLTQVFSGDLKAQFGLDETAFGRLVLILPGVYIPAQMIAGFLFDRYGARPPLVCAAVFAAGGLAMSVVVDNPTLGASGRALFAVGAAFAFVGALFVAARAFEGSRFAGLAGLIQGGGFALLAWWLVMGTPIHTELAFPRAFYAAAAGAIGLGLLLAIFAGIRPVQDGADRPGFFRQVLSEIGSILVRPRLWMILIGATLAGIPFGIYAPIWAVEPSLPAPVLAEFPRTEMTALFLSGFALGSLFSGYFSSAIGRRRATLFLFQVFGAATLMVIATTSSLIPLMAGALITAGGFFLGGCILYYALGNDRAPPHHAGLFLALIHGAFVLGAAGSAYVPSLIAPYVTIPDFAPLLAPASLAVAAILGLLIPDKGPVEMPGPVADWKRGAEAVGETDLEQPSGTTVDDKTETGSSEPAKPKDKSSGSDPDKTEAVRAEPTGEPKPEEAADATSDAGKETDAAPEPVKEANAANTDSPEPGLKQTPDAQPKNETADQKKEAEPDAKSEATTEPLPDRTKA